MFSFMERKFIESIEQDDYSRERLPSDYIEILKTLDEIV